MSSSPNAKNASVPAFEAPITEQRAYTVMELLSGKSASLTLSASDRQHVDALVVAVRQGNKARVIQLSSDYYAELLSPERLAAAYELIKAQAVHGNPDFQIVMDALREKDAGQLAQQQPGRLPTISLAEALLQILLTITRSDKNSISYHRHDEQTGKLRPTTFPLTESLIRNFLAPFGDQSALIKGVILFSRGQVIANPAALLAQRCRQRLKHFQEQQAAAAKKQAELAEKLAEKASKPAPSRITPGPKPARPAGPDSVQEVRFLSAELEKLLNGSRDGAEKEALSHVLQPEQLVQLVEIAAQPAGTDFGKTLENMYARHLSRQQASFLSARLSSRMKRMLSQMGDWKDEYWSEFQTLMLNNGVWEGSEWLEKWRACKKGKQHITKTGKDYLVSEKTNPLDEMLARSDKMQSQIRGSKMLSPNTWVRPERSSAPPEQRRLLAALARPDRLLELIEISIQTETWESTPELLQQRLYEAFCVLSDSDFDTIKQQFLAGVAPELAERAKTLITVIELKFNQISSLFKQDVRLSYSDALDILVSRQRETEHREKLNSQAWQQSPAAQYTRYNQA